MAEKYTNEGGKTTQCETDIRVFYSSCNELRVQPGECR